MAGELTLNFPDIYGGPIAFDIKGMEELSRRLSLLAEALPEAVGNALRAEAEIEMTEAKRRTPVDTGALRASGNVQGPIQDGNDQMVILGFGGPAGTGNQGETNLMDVGYAVYVHEDEEKFHPVGEAKFLENTLLKSAPHLADRVANRLARTTAGLQALVNMQTRMLGSAITGG